MRTNNVQALLAQDISDPTDFPLSDLRQLDASCRCTICGEFFDAPISLACGHCFCSMCIREHIAKEPECPRCRKTVAEAHFRANPTLEDVVSSWKAARSNVLRLLRKEPFMAVSDRNSNSDTTPQISQTPVRNGRKRRHSEVSQSSGSDVVCVAGPSNSNKSNEAADPSPLQAKSSRKVSRWQADTEPSSDPREEELSVLQPDSIVECPICGDSVKYQAINTHMDGPDCGRKSESKANPSTPNAKARWSKLLGSKPTKGKNRDNSGSGEAMERLPKVSYDVLKDKALKELLASQQLPVNGDRNIRIARHKRWVMMHNANLDKNSGRKTLPELRLELKMWEESQKESKYVVEDLSAYEVLHKEHFSKLVDEVRKKRSNCKLLSDVLREEVAEDNQDGNLQDVG